MKSSFPIFKHETNLVYLDSAATSLKPETVIATERAYEESYSANIARGLYPLADRATSAFEDARTKVARFIGATPEEIIFTSGTTNGINLAAQMLSSVIPSKVEGSKIPPLEDSVGMTKANIVVTELEHHSNFLPWKELARLKNIELRIAPFTTEGLIDIYALSSLVDEQTVVTAFSVVSNVFGGINPAHDIIRLAKEKNPNVITLVDAAQAVGHINVNVQEWGADFMAFSGHKMYGPTGIGVLYGKKEMLETLAPVTFGGGMVTDSCAPIPEYREIPYRFEAGTPNISGAIGLGAAIDFIEKIGIEHIRTHDTTIAKYATEKLLEAFTDTIRIIGPNDPERRSALLSFTLKGIHPHDLAALLGERNICIRAGEHCAAPLHRALDLPATARISFGIYTTKEDIDRLITEMSSAIKILNF